MGSHPMSVSLSFIVLKMRLPTNGVLLCEPRGEGWLVSTTELRVTSISAR